MHTNSARRGSLSRRHTSSITALLSDKRCVLYVRASTEDQQHTLDAQQFEARRFCEANGLTVTHVFIESGVSGSKPFMERKEARSALATMKREGIATLLSMTLDRAFRNIVDMHQTIEHLLESGYNFRVVSPDLDLRGPIGKMIASVLGSVAELELATRSQRQQRGFDTMRRQRLARSNNPPYGWKLGDEVPADTSHAGKPYRRLIAVPEEQEVLRELLRRYDKQETLQSIADDLNQRGILTKKAGQSMTRHGKTTTITGTWKPQTVKSVIEHADLDEEPAPVRGEDTPVLLTHQPRLPRESDIPV